MSDDKTNLSDGVRTALIFKALVRCEAVRELTESFYRATGLTLKLLPPQRPQHMAQAALPIVVGGQPAAILVVGQAKFRHCAPQDRFVGCVRLMGVLARLIGECAGRWMLADDGDEPIAVQRAKEFVHAHVGKRIAMRAVADHVHLSAQHFCKLFKQTTGMTLTDYVWRAQVERAKERLCDPHLSVKEAAFSSGFQSLSHFNHVFGKLVGVSPTDYRANMRQKKANRAAVK